MPASSSQMTQTRVKPQALKPGDTIAVVSTSYPTDEPEATFAKGVSLLEEQGFRVKLMPHAKDKWHYLAGRDADRLSDLHQAFADPEVKGILCARGGYGAMRLVSEIDFDLVRQHPKVFMGYSDITVLHLAFYQEAGLGGFYSPMLTANLTNGEPYSLERLLSMVMGKQAVPFELANNPALTGDPYTCLKPGVAEGPLIGGNMSLLSALCGTRFQPKTAGHILFIEDWKEQHYSIDRQYQQLKMAGLLDDIRGLIFCDFSEIQKEPDQTLPELFDELTQDLRQRGIPVGYSLPVGHGPQTATLPYGVQTRFDAATGTLTFLESPFTN